MTDRAGKQGRYPPPPSLSLPPSHPLRGVTGCSRAGRVKQGRYHPPRQCRVGGWRPSPPFPLPSPPSRDWSLASRGCDCAGRVKQGRYHAPSPLFPLPLLRGGRLVVLAAWVTGCGREWMVVLAA